MESRYTEEGIIQCVIEVLISIHKGDELTIQKLCLPDALWKYDHRVGERNIAATNGASGIAAPKAIFRFVRQDYHIKRLDGDHAVVTGNYRIEFPAGMCLKPLYGDYTIVLAGKKAAFVQVETGQEPVLRHRITAVDEAVYNLKESDILYVEALRGHALWHCGNTVVETVDTLTYLETILSEDFVRIHRSFIVNKKNAASIQRCGGKSGIVVMANGDVIPVPYKKYVAARTKLFDSQNR